MARLNFCPKLHYHTFLFTLTNKLNFTYALSEKHEILFLFFKET